MKLQFRLPVLVIMLFMIVGCEEADTDIDALEDLVMIGAASDAELTVEMYGDHALQVGLNKIYFQVLNKATEDQIEDILISQQPMMQMETIAHSCPVDGPTDVPNSDGLFESEVVFIMASGMMGSWSDTLSIHRESTNTHHQVVFENLSVVETNMKKNLVFLDGDSNQVIYIVTLNGLEDPEVGVNEIVVTVHKKQSMMSFPEVSGLSMTLDPQMPDMGHGSIGNIDPVYTSAGKYEGVVAFNMTGYWTLDIDVSLDGTDLGTVQYEFNF